MFKNGVIIYRDKTKKGSNLNLKISWKIRGQHRLRPTTKNYPRGKGGYDGGCLGDPPPYRIVGGVFTVYK
jgi:hypothetical protein